MRRRGSFAEKVVVGLVVALVTACSNPSSTGVPSSTDSAKAGTLPGSSSLQVTFHGRWDTQPAIPFPRAHFAITIADERIYVVGGSANASGPVPTVERYDPGLKRWEKVADLPIAVDHLQAASVGQDVYAFGGFLSYSSKQSDRAFRYDAKNNRWVEIARMPEPRAAGGAAVVQGAIYLAGGWDMQQSVLMYDPQADQWTHVTDIPTIRHHAVVLPYRGQVCIIGGRGKSSVFECYDPAGKTWTDLPEPPSEIDDVGGAVFDEYIWIIGRNVQVFDGKQWWTGPDLQNPRWGLGTAVVGDKLYAVSGVGDSGKVTGEVESFELRQ